MSFFESFEPRRLLSGTDPAICIAAAEPIVSDGAIEVSADPFVIADDSDATVDDDALVFTAFADEECPDAVKRTVDGESAATDGDSAETPTDESIVENDDAILWTLFSDDGCQDAVKRTVGGDEAQATDVNPETSTDENAVVDEDAIIRWKSETDVGECFDAPTDESSPAATDEFEVPEDAQTFGGGTVLATAFATDAPVIGAESESVELLPAAETDEVAVPDDAQTFGGGTVLATDFATDGPVVGAQGQAGDRDEPAANARPELAALPEATVTPRRNADGIFGKDESADDLAGMLTA